MGIYDRNYYRDDQDNSFLSMNNGVSGRSMVLILIGINVAVFLIDAFSGFDGNGSQFSRFLALRETDAVQPWYWFRILTAAFSHADTGHIFGNMLVLFFFGRPIERVYGSKIFLWAYLTAAIFANLVWLGAEVANGPPLGIAVPLLGASGATTAMFVLFCIHFPHQKIYLLFFPFFGIPAWLMGVIIIGQDLMGQLGVGGESNVAFLVHLAGAAYAFIFFRTKWTLFQLLPSNLANGSVTKALRPKPKLRVHRPDTGDSDLERQADLVLKKLHEHGEASLSARERRILEEYSRSINQRR